MLQIILVAETAGEPSLLKPLLDIIRTDIEIPLFIRTRCLRALKPLVHKIGLKVTNEILKLLITKINLPCEIKMQAYSILLERPTPSIVHACMSRIIGLEKCSIARRYVYETLLALTVRRDILIPEHT